MPNNNRDSGNYDVDESEHEQQAEGAADRLIVLADPKEHDSDIGKKRDKMQNQSGIKRKLLGTEQKIGGGK